MLGITFTYFHDSYQFQHNIFIRLMILYSRRYIVHMTNSSYMHKVLYLSYDQLYTAEQLLHNMESMLWVYTKLVCQYVRSNITFSSRVTHVS